MSDLYETDLARWSEHQAALLRRRATGQLVNDADLGWPDIAEEIEALGRSERSGLRSKITTAIEHLMRLKASPATDPRRSWKITMIHARGDIAELLMTAQACAGSSRRCWPVRHSGRGRM